MNQFQIKLANFQVSILQYIFLDLSINEIDFNIMDDIIDPL